MLPNSAGLSLKMSGAAALQRPCPAVWCSMDTLTPVERSERMARVRGRGNQSTELRLIALFRQHGIKGWRRGRALPGNPDFAFPPLRVVVFVDGCFWHCCPIHYRCPKSRVEFWDAKAKGNALRDAAVNELLQAKGWSVVRIWEHELWPAGHAAAIAKIIAALGDRARSPR